MVFEFEKKETWLAPIAMDVFPKFSLVVNWLPEHAHSIDQRTGRPRLKQWIRSDVEVQKQYKHNGIIFQNELDALLFFFKNNQHKFLSAQIYDNREKPPFSNRGIYITQKNADGHTTGYWRRNIEHLSNEYFTDLIKRINLL